MAELYLIRSRDQVFLQSAASLLKKVAAAEITKPAQLISIAKLLHVLSVLPRVTTGVTASVSVCSPKHKFDDVETYHWWDFAVEGDQLRISSAGHFYRPSTGGDSFTTVIWEAVPEEPAELNDYRESLWMVPDVRTFTEGVESIDLAVEGYRVEIIDDDNRLLHDEQDEVVEDENAGVAGDKELEDSESEVEPAVERTPDRWSVTPIDAAEEQLAALVDSYQVERQEPAYAYDVDCCNHCGCILSQRGLYVDGRLRGDRSWSNMCAGCFWNLGEGIGRGNGQVYARQPDGRWRLVVGLAPKDQLPSKDY